MLQQRENIFQSHQQTQEPVRDGRLPSHYLLHITITRLCWYYTTVQDNTCLLLRVCKTLSLLNLMCNANDIVCFCCMLTGLTSLLYYTYTTGPYYKPCSTYSTGAVIIRVAAASFHSFTSVIYFVL